MSLREADVDHMWEKLGFDIRNARDVIATLRVNGKVVARTKRSHGARKLDGQIPHLIRQQMRLSAAEFKDAYECPLDKEGYLAILERKGLLG